MMAMRALKRRLSNVIFARMLADQKRREAGRAGDGGPDSYHRVGVRSGAEL